MPKRIQRKRTKGWRMPESSVYVGRPTKLGNPADIEGAIEAGFAETKEEARAICVEWFSEWLAGQHPEWSYGGPMRERLLSSLRELRGKDLVCWCPLDQPCHADVLLEIANP